MNPYQNAVLDFHHAMNQPAPETPTLDGYPFEFRTRLILEEALEFTKACGLHPGEAVAAVHFSDKTVTRETPPKWPEMIDALCDILYVTFGAANSMGIDLDVFFQAVHAANMLKTTGPVREDGKRLKPPGWTPPDIAGLLRAQLEKAKP